MQAITRRTLAAIGWPRQPAETPPPPTEADAAAPLLQLWARHLDAATTHGTESVDALTRTFADIERQLADAAQTAASAAGSFGGAGGMAGVVDEARQRLQAVLSHIESAAATKHALLASIAEAVKATAELRETARSVERIAQMTTLLSINARVEAARAGSAGAGFAVVADEVRRLAAMARDDSQAILARVERIGSVVGAAAGAGEQMRQGDAELMATCRAEVGEVTEAFGRSMEQLIGTADTLGACAQGLRGSVAAALLDFQYQDRVSQRLQHVQANVEAFADGLSGGWPAADALADLETRLYASYTMPDEQRTHRGEAAPAAAAGDDADGLTLF